jgi:hypothetical protein
MLALLLRRPDLHPETGHRPPAEIH